MHREKTFLVSGRVDPGIGDDFNSSPAEGRRDAASALHSRKDGVQVRPGGSDVKGAGPAEQQPLKSGAEGRNKLRAGPGRGIFCLN
jgi:hypothetical protein